VPNRETHRSKEAEEFPQPLPCPVVLRTAMFQDVSAPVLPDAMIENSQAMADRKLRFSRLRIPGTPLHIHILQNIL
jgi:hypothetical protein